MPEFLSLLSPSEALQRFLLALPVPVLESEIVDTESSLGRVTAEPIIAPHPLPSFHRSTVDGYAVRAIDTYGANESLPVYLSLSGEVLMGYATNLNLSPAQCALIHTGGMLPEGADAVVMIEFSQPSRTGEVEILRPVATGENILRIGEDVASGEVVIPDGVRLRPAEIGGLMALGFTRVMVRSKPKIGIISSGDEVVSPEMEIQPGQVRDINSYTLGSLIEETGGIAIRYGIFPDRVDTLQTAAKRALTECDMVVITAGSSASARDITAQVINTLGHPGVLVHGINIRPGKPTILAVCNGKAVIGLPGNPVSALVVARLIVIPVVESLLSLRNVTLRNYTNQQSSVQARLTINVPSQAGREDWIPVRLKATPEGISAEPLFGKSNLIFTLVQADGLVCIPADVTGRVAGDVVEVKFLHH